MKKKRILLVEDDRYLVKIYSNKLTSAGFEVDIAIATDEALRKVTQQCPDMIYLDLILPGKDGFEFLEDLAAQRKRKKKIPVVILSNLGQAIDMKRTKELGAVDYLIKANVSLQDIVQKARHYTSQ